MPRRKVRKVYICVPSTGKTRDEVEALRSDIREKLNSFLGENWIELPVSYEFDYSVKTGYIGSMFAALGQSIKLVGDATDFAYKPDIWDDWRSTMEWTAAKHVYENGKCRINMIVVD